LIGMDDTYQILIIGDSFAADWSIKYRDYPGWPNLLAEKYHVTNLAQAGVSEYKIYKQLLSIDNLEKYDLVIVSHTSPYRIYTQRHPVHCHDALHKDADLMANDLHYHGSKIKNLFNISLKCALQFFKYHSDQDYLDTVYRLFREKINDGLKNKKIIVISNLKHLEPFMTESTVLNYSDLLLLSPGIVNHLSPQANMAVYQGVVDQIQQLLKDDK